MHNNYKVKIKILSPVHIGAGADKNWQRGADFVHHKGQIFILNQRATWLELDDRQQRRYLDFMNMGKFPEVERLIVDELDLDAIATYSFEYNGRLNAREIKTLIRDGNGHAYIPGSSIKGAMSSAIYHFLHNAINPINYNEYTSKELLGIFDKALGRYIRPSDTDTLQTEVNDVDLYNLYRNGTVWEGDYKQNFTIVTETFKPNTEGVFRLSLADDLANFIRKQKGEVALPTYYKNTFGDKPLENLFQIINSYTRTHALRERAYFEKYNNQDEIDTVLEKLEEIIKETNTLNEKSCLLQMSFGSGFHGITGDYRFKDHNVTIEKPDTRNLIYNRITKQKDPARYKSRRLVFPYNGIMGYVRLDASE